MILQKCAQCDMLYFGSPLDSCDAMQQTKRSLHHHVIGAGLRKTRAPTCQQLCLPNGSEHSPFSFFHLTG